VRAAAGEGGGPQQSISTTRIVITGLSLCHAEHHPCWTSACMSLLLLFVFVLLKVPGSCMTLWFYLAPDLSLYDASTVRPVDNEMW
jgi:hypothetical protein